MSNLAFKDACALVIIQIGEHVNRLSEEFKKEHNEMPWSDIIGMRIIHAHNYDSVIDEIVWESIQDEIPQLKEYLEDILYNNSNDKIK